MKRGYVVGVTVILAAASLALFGAGTASARWWQLDVLMFHEQRTCTDGVYFGLADTAPLLYDVVARFGNTILTSRTVTLTENAVGLPLGFLYNYSGYYAFHWPVPLSRGSQVTIDISLTDRPEPKPHRLRTVTVEDCSMASMPGGTVMHVCSAEVPQTLVTSTQSTLLVPTSLNIVDVDVQLFITHTWDADVGATLVSPNGTSVELFNEVGGSENNFGTSCGTANLSPRLYLEDGGETPITGTTAVPPYTAKASYSPTDPLSRFNGEVAKGPWTLNLVDTVPQSDDGRLLCWCLNVNGYYVNHLPLTLKAH
jgi:subtilisin-like proprotein convertase family protein